MYDLQLQIGDCRFSLRRSLLNSYRCQTNAARHSPFTFDVSLSHLTIDYFRQRERNLQSVISRYMQPVNLYSFRKKLSLRKKIFSKYLKKIEKSPPRGLDKLIPEINADIWKEVDCLSCANCCKKMSPTYTAKDIKRISRHLGMRSSEFKEKWLYFDKKDGDWMNKSTPCQFLDLKTNMCTIYSVRPQDCAGFPHLTKRKMTDYMHVHKQNLSYCPATFKMVEKMMQRLPV